MYSVCVCVCASVRACSYTRVYMHDVCGHFAKGFLDLCDLIYISFQLAAA